MSDAIREDVSAEQEPAALTPEQLAEQNNAALKADIYKKNDQLRDTLADRYDRERRARLGLATEEELEEGKEEVEEDSEPQSFDSDEEEPAPEQEAKEQRAAPKAAADVPVYQNANGEWVTKLKVNGQEQEVPYEKVRAQLQKHAAADQRLQHATELLRKAEERERILAEREQRLRQSVQLPTGVDSAEEIDAKSKKIIEKLLDGDADEAAADLAKLLRGRAQPAPTPDLSEIEEKAARRAMAKIEEAEYQRDLNRGHQRFVETYPDIINDADLFNLANQKTIELQKEKPYLTPSEILMEAGEYVSNRFLKTSQRKPVGEVDQNRRTRKDSLKPMPKPANAKTARPAPERVPTKADWLMEQRRLRGQL